MIKIKQDKEDCFSFRLESEKGHTILKSITFTTKTDLDNVVSKLESLIKTPTLLERKTNHIGEFLFTLKDDYGTIIATSECYNSEAGMENGIKNLKKLSGLNTNT